MENIIRLENWGIVIRRQPGEFPERGMDSLTGDAYGHPRFDDGITVTTSSIVGKEGDLIRTNSGSLYQLGEVAEKYEKLFPNARERFLKSLEEVKGE